MAKLQTSDQLGQPAQNFDLPGVDGKTYNLESVRGANGTVVAFISNHCPYVKAIAGRMVEDAKSLAQEGIGFIAICSNDAVSYPDDSLDNMKLFAEQHDFPFPYVQDRTQEVARAYDAVCTPEFYGLNRAGAIAYHGRLDQGRVDAPPPDAKRELVEAMLMVIRTGRGPDEQLPAIGCSIKWKN